MLNSAMNFVTIDFETAKKSQESACSVGLVKFINGKPEETYYSLIRPPSLYIRPDFTDIHGLTVDDVKDAPKFKDIWESAILPFIGDFPLVAHYAKFDMGVLRGVLEWYKLPFPKLNYFSKNAKKLLHSSFLCDIVIQFRFLRTKITRSPI